MRRAGLVRGRYAPTVATHPFPSSDKQAREWEEDAEKKRAAQKTTEDLSKLVSLAEEQLEELRGISAAVKAMTEAINGLPGRLSDR